MAVDEGQDGPADNNVVRYRGVSMRFLKEFMDKMLQEELGMGVRLMVLLQELDVETLQGIVVTLRSGTTIRMKKRYHDGTMRCRAPYVGVFDIAPGVKYEEKPRERWSIEDVCEYIVLEETREDKLFYLDLLQMADVGTRFQGAFISQARKSTFVTLVESLLNRFKGADLFEQFVWIDLFCANQPILTSRDQDLSQSVQKNREELLKVGLHDAIRKFDDRLIFFNSWLKPFPIERAWCVWEIFGCVKSEQSLDILFQPGEEQLFVETLLKDRQLVTKRIMDLRLENAECFAEKDKRDIDQAVQEQIGYHKLNVTISNLLIKWLKLFLHDVIEQKRADNNEGFESAQILYEAGIFLTRQLGANDEALDLLRQSVEIFENIHGGREHPDVANTLHEIARVLQSKGEYDAALRQTKEVLRTQEKAYGGRDHPEVATTLNAIAQILQHQGEHDAALIQFEEVLSARERAYGSRDHPKVANTLHEIGRVLHHKGDYDGALKQFEEVCRIRENVYGGRDHPKVANTLHEVARVLGEKGEYELAMIQFEEVLRIREKAYGGRDHPKVKDTLYELARTEQQKKQAK